MFELAALIAGFSTLNRFAGGGVGWRATFSGRPIYYAGAAAIVVLGIAHGWLGVLAGASFLLWRLPAWYRAIDGGRIDQTPLRDFLVMSARGLVAAPIFIYQAFAGQPLALLYLLAFCLLQGAVYDVAARMFKKEHTAKAEWASGVVWGVILYLLLN